ncbi:hypothetical protein BN134_3197 [Cronobacter dublinensis 1210]|uniref:Uncharacterized protein n=1 Tax=Cronobacter dublinensis 1210 TaxID=1208656 RepID=A0ABP1WDR5_9ENTR|nr:hypothetical protein BN134_3197 [Cronobacter dublinensis 1210]
MHPKILKNSVCKEKKEFVIGCIYSGGVDIASLNDKAACFVVWIKENIKAHRLIVTSLK